MPIKPSENYSLETPVWTEVDFDKMGWHDVIVHGLGFNLEEDEFLLDIDYILAWVEPEPPSPYFSFWMAPATLVFHQASELKMDYDASLGFQLQGIERGESRCVELVDSGEYRRDVLWTLDGNEGSISLWAPRYTQFIRKRPVRSKAQAFSLSERGGISFERTMIS